MLLAVKVKCEEVVVRCENVIVEEREAYLSHLYP